MKQSYQSSVLVEAKVNIDRQKLSSIVARSVKYSLNVLGLA